MRSAVLFLVFNRPDTTRKVFEAIRAARPPRLYIAADGPRPHKNGEIDKCQQVRDIATAVDWPCEVKTLFNDVNLGCRLGPVNGITWFFENEEEGIILEDDVLPLPSFFHFCDELLERYRQDVRVSMISGNNFYSQKLPGDASYLFSLYTHIWGWATWRRSWQNYDVNMGEWPMWKVEQKLSKMGYGGSRFNQFWETKFQQSYSGEIADAWDYQWTFACWKVRGLTILPKFNLINNIGFGEDATHTFGDAPEFVRVAIPRDITFPLNHPKEVARNIKFDNAIQNLIFSPTLLQRFVQRVKNISRCLDN